MSDTFKIPFSVYDFFGYLSVGLLLCFGVDIALGTSWLQKESIPLPQAVAWVLVAYVVGHINANLSAWGYEHFIVGKVLRRPNENLFRKAPSGILGKLFSGYYTALPVPLQERILQKASRYGINTPGETLFHHVRTVGKKDPITWSRVESFLERYGFCRNVSFALLATSAVLVTQWFRLGTHVLAQTAALSLLGAIGMFYRYLKFYRQYSYELFTSYPDLTQGENR